MELSGQLHAPAALLPREKADRKLGEPQSQSGHGDEEKHSQHLPGLKPAIIQHITWSYPGSYNLLGPYILLNTLFSMYILL
jgi:hypothetical protein